MSEQNVADLICFLNTLTDGYQPPASAPTTGPCTQ
jgi:cytochrome c peroxidase